ncbi:MAG TPA: carbohydrate kinase, partial [Blastocatellia bacterium]|nr:carbohydrate kinase [Blastocatellia bacterium]
MDSRQYWIVGLGELLWDLLPGGRHLGGAPANFAYHASRLGNHGVIASRVGNDCLGVEALERLREQGLTAEYIQVDAAHPTGTVRVRVDEGGQPDFTIAEGAAWDWMEWTPQWEGLAARADAVCFGSLAQRSPRSRETIYQFLAATRKEALRIFDVNLRQSFYSRDCLDESMKLAGIAKLNDQELPEVARLFGLGCGSLEERARNLLRAYGLQLVCVTRGARGSMLVSATETAEHAGIPARVTDTVGAGDAFTAALASYYLRGASLAQMNEAANRLGSWVAS